MQKKSWITILILSIYHLTGFAQTNYDSFSLYYGFAGLGSNFGRMCPTIRIEGTGLVYTKEQNSFYKSMPPQEPDTILTCTITTSAIDSILVIIEDLKDTSIFEFNPCIMSGGIHNMRVSFEGDTAAFSLQNTFHHAALSIIRIINPYLPEKNRIRASEKLILDCEECWAAMRNKSEGE